MDQIYMDYAATAPLREAAKEEMLRVEAEAFGNPNSPGPMGSRASREMMEARDGLAFMLNVQPREIIYGSGATEANNQAIQTGVAYAREKGLLTADQKVHVVSSEMEHESVLAPLRRLEQAGAIELTLIHPGHDGIVTPDLLRAALRPETGFVTLMAVNNEVGTIQPVKELVDLVRQAQGLKRIVFHTDAVQALPHLRFDVNAWGVDLLSLSAHKFGGPKGVGALVVRAPLAAEPLMFGGPQERGLRPGTLNVPGIAGLTKALEEMRLNFHEENERVVANGKALTDALRSLPGVTLTVHPADRVPSIIHITIEGKNSGLLIAQLGRKGISVAAGSACQAGAVEVSHVMGALDVPEDRRSGALRFSIGASTTEEDVHRAVSALREILES